MPRQPRPFSDIAGQVAAGESPAVAGGFQGAAQRGMEHLGRAAHQTGQQQPRDPNEPLSQEEMRYNAERSAELAHIKGPQPTTAEGHKARQRYEGLEDDPEFGKLPWKAQQMVRSELAQQFLPNTEGFAELPSEAQDMVFEELVMKPPVFEDERLAAVTQQVKQRIQEHPDDPAVTEMLSKLNNRDHLLGTIQQMAPREGSIELKGAEIRRLEPNEIEQIFKENDGDLDELYTGSNADKLQQYISYLGSKENSSAIEMQHNYDRFGQMATSAVLMGASLYGGAKVMAPLYRAGPAVGKAIASRMGWGERAATVASEAFKGTSTSLAGSAMYTGLYEAIDHTTPEARAVLEDDAGIDWQGIARRFGISTALSLGISYGISGYKLTFGSLKNAERMWNNGQYSRLGQQTDQELRKAGAVPGTQLDEATLSMLPDETQHIYRNKQRVADISRSEAFRNNEVRNNPEDFTIFTGSQQGMYANPITDEAGRTKYRLLYDRVEHSSKPPKPVWEDVDDLVSLRNRMGEVFRQQVVQAKQEHGPQYASMMVDRNPYMANWATAGSQMDSLFDARYAFDENPAALRRQAKNFVSPAERTYVTPDEASKTRTFARTMRSARTPDEGEAAAFRFSVADEVLEDGIRRGNIRFRPSSKGDFIAASNKMANPQHAQILDQRAKRIQELNPGLYDDATARKVAALDNGFDAVRHQDGSIEYLFPNKVKRVAANIDTKTGKLLSNITQEPAGGFDNYLARGKQMAKAQVRAKIPAAAATQDADVLSLAAMNVRGKIDSLKQATVRDIGKAFANRFELPERNVSVKLSKYANRIDAEGNVASVARTADGMEIRLPSSISDQGAHQKMVRQLFDGLEEVTAGRKAKKGAQTLGQKVEDAYVKESGRFTNPMSSPQGRANWVESIVRNEGDGTIQRVGDQFRVQLPDTQPADFRTLDEAYQRVMERSWTPQQLKAEFAQRGINLTEAKDGTLRATAKGWGETLEARSAAEMMDKLNYRPTKLPQAYAPQVVDVSPQSFTVEFDGFAYRTHNTKDALQMLSKFEDAAYLAKQTKLRSLKDAEIYRNHIGEVDVRLPNMASRLTFKDQKEALNFVRNSLGEMDGYERIAHQKGLNLSYYNGRWAVADGRSVSYAQSKKELERILKSYPDPEAAPNIFAEVDPRLARQLDILEESGAIGTSARVLPSPGSGVYYDFEGIVPNAPPDRGFFKVLGDTLSKTINPMEWYMENQVRQQHPELYRLFKTMDHGRRASIKATNDMMNDHVLPAATRADGKLLRNKQLQKAFYHLEASDDTQREWAVRNFGELDADEARFVESIRNLFGGVTEEGLVTGLGQRFSIPPHKMIQEYMPRIRQYIDSNKVDLNSFKTADELLDRVFGSNRKAAAAIKPFFENDRASEVVTFARDDNALRVMMKYTTLGNKKAYMNDAWKGISEYMRTHNVSHEQQQKINLFREQIMGTHRPAGYDKVGDIGEALYRSLGATDPMAGRQIFEKFMSLNYFTNMVYRPYLAIRNSFQPFTTLAPRFGNQNVLRAYSDVAKMGSEYFDYLRNVGLIVDSPPIVNQTHDLSSYMGYALKRGLRMYTKSDQLTRAVAFRTGENLIDDALEAANRGQLADRASFMKKAGLNKINPTLAEDIMSDIHHGTPDSIARAKTRFGVQLSEETMFAYRPEQMPELHSKHIIGKMFGQYGTYSAGYRANLLRGLQYGDAQDKAEFVTRFVGNHVALFGGIGALGINAYNFIPGGPVAFGGGPNFDLLVDGIRMMGGGWQGQEAARNVMTQYSPYAQGNWQIPNQVPVARQVRGLLEAHEYAQSGDYWKAFLAGTWTPIRRDQHFWPFD